MRSPGYNLRLDFFKRETGVSVEGFFSDHGVMGTLDASDYENVDKVSPFPGAIIDRFCGFTETAVTAAAYAQYGDTVQRVNKRYGIPAWTL